MNILKYCLKSKIDSSIIGSSLKRSYTNLCYKAPIVLKNNVLLSVNQSTPRSTVSSCCFMKKAGLNPIYDVYNKKAAKDNLSPTEYELVYNGVGEKYVRYLSGVVVLAFILMPTIFIVTYIYLVFKDGSLDLKTYLEVLMLPQSSFELAVMLPVLFVMKFIAYCFISKYVLRIYRHNTKMEHIGVFINPFLPWKNVTCAFERAVKLPDGKIFIVPWHKEYYTLAGHKSIVIRERFRRPIDYEKMLGTEKKMDEIY